MSAKDCGNHGQSRKKLLRGLLAGILILVFLVLLAVLLIWAILRPTKPTFILQDATIYAFNVSAPTNSLTSSLQITLASRNPNAKIGVYYDRLDIYANYRGQQITLATRIGPVYQGHKEVNVWSPVLYGPNVPVAPFNGIALSQDQAAGMVLLLIKIDGRVRWKVGTFISGGYHLHVTCPAYISFGSRSTGIVIGDAIKYQLVQRCSVNV
ncbi:NDR1/HIN1-like protein 1 [Malania oleifera]|uniref:NDR1/HIN1-like protein 1 n=1 Tax=Malania oleifera TaxID=397392 RepID=UPI0025AE6BC4|nr:NDR1/HIN1-like protein 1 [Malania oleifera]